MSFFSVLTHVCTLRETKEEKSLATSKPRTADWFSLVLPSQRTAILRSLYPCSLFYSPFSFPQVVKGAVDVWLYAFMNSGCSIKKVFVRTGSMCWFIEPMRGERSAIFELRDLETTKFVDKISYFIPFDILSHPNHSSTEFSS